MLNLAKNSAAHVCADCAQSLLPNLLSRRRRVTFRQLYADPVFQKPALIHPISKFSRQPHSLGICASCWNLINNFTNFGETERDLGITPQFFFPTAPGHHFFSAERTFMRNLDNIFVNTQYACHSSMHIGSYVPSHQPKIVGCIYPFFLSGTLTPSSSSLLVWIERGIAIGINEGLLGKRRPCPSYWNWIGRL